MSEGRFEGMNVYMCLLRIVCVYVCVYVCLYMYVVCVAWYAVYLGMCLV